MPIHENDAVSSVSEPPPIADSIGLIEPVRLNVPASPRYLSAARVVATSLGAECGLTVDDLDDLRLGVDELVSMLIEAASPDARIDLEFDASDGSITVRGRVVGTRVSEASDIDELTRRIVEAVADHHVLDRSSFSLTKDSSLRDER